MLEFKRQSKIAQLHGTILLDKEVRGLDIKVGKACIMNMLDGRGHLEKYSPQINF